MIVVRCDNQLESVDFWRAALEAVKFERLTTRTNGRKVGTNTSGKLTLGWEWLGKLTGEFLTALSTERSEQDSRERVLAKASPAHLIPVLQEANALLVIEDFHYLNPGVQKTIFQQWKAFVDAEVSVVVIGTTHHACDLADANKDLVGRISTIQLSSWLENDLRMIVRNGANALNVTVEFDTERRIAAESVGLPIVTQGVAQALFLKHNIEEAASVPKELTVSRKELHHVFNELANSSYRQFREMYDRIISGLRRKARYKTYECLLLAFADDPIAFRLRRGEIIDRIQRLSIPDSARPPEGSIKHSLSHLKKLQEKLGCELLEWVPRDDILYIVEPTFLFYLRWRNAREDGSDRKVLFESLFDNLEVIISSRGRHSLETVRVLSKGTEKG